MHARHTCWASTASGRSSTTIIRELIRKDLPTGQIPVYRMSADANRAFTAAVDDATLARVAHASGVPYMVDLGAGALIDAAAAGDADDLLGQIQVEPGVARGGRPAVRDPLGR